MKKLRRAARKFRLLLLTLAGGLFGSGFLSCDEPPVNPRTRASHLLFDYRVALEQGLLDIANKEIDDAVLREILMHPNKSGMTWKFCTQLPTRFHTLANCSAWSSSPSRLGS